MAKEPGKHSLLAGWQRAQLKIRFVTEKEEGMDIGKQLAAPNIHVNRILKRNTNVKDFKTVNFTNKLM